MHETALCSALLKTVRQELEEHRLEEDQVVGLRVVAGALRQILPAALQQAWLVVSQGTRLSQCTLQIDIVPVRVSCSDCQARSELPGLVFVCPRCGSTSVEMESGDEFQLASMEIKT